jgi:hypothetical protein
VRKTILASLFLGLVLNASTSLAWDADLIITHVQLQSILNQIPKIQTGNEKEPTLPELCLHAGGLNALVTAALFQYPAYLSEAVAACDAKNGTSIKKDVDSLSDALEILEGVCGVAEYDQGHGRNIPSTTTGNVNLLYAAVEKVRKTVGSADFKLERNCIAGKKF